VEDVNKLFGIQDEAIEVSRQYGAAGGRKNKKEAKRMQRQLVEEAKGLKRNIKAFNRQKARRSGLTKAPCNTEDLLQAALPVLKDIRDGINQLVDIQRYRVCTLSSCHTIMLTCCNRLVSIPSSRNLTTPLRLLTVLVWFPLLLSYLLWLLLLLF
jgi:hypothetical protein